MPRVAWKLSKCHAWHQILFFRATRGKPGREATNGTRKRDSMPHVAWRLSECHAWHHISGGDLIWIMPRVVQKMRNMCPNPNQHVRRQGRRGAAFMPRVAHAPPRGGACGVSPRVAREPGGGRSGRRACHTWHINRAGGRAGGVGPRVVGEPGRGATRGTRK